MSATRSQSLAAINGHHFWMGESWGALTEVSGLPPASTAVHAEHPLPAAGHHPSAHALTWRRAAACSSWSNPDFWLDAA